MSRDAVTYSVEAAVLLYTQADLGSMQLDTVSLTPRGQGWLADGFTQDVH